MSKVSPLARFRERHCLTQREAAAAVGVGLSTWRQVETGFRGRTAPLSMLRHLAALDALAGRGMSWPTEIGEGYGDDDEG